MVMGNSPQSLTRPPVLKILLVGFLLWGVVTIRLLFVVVVFGLTTPPFSFPLRLGGVL